MSRPDPASASFDDLVAVPEHELDLAAAALAFAADAYPDLDRAAALARLDEMASAVAARTVDGAALTDRIRALNAYLFDECGFRGNTERYSDPRNSYLNEVLERRLGIPISLSVLYLELAWRLGLAFEGVSFPGHFLVKCAVNGGQLVLDPYHGGVSLGEQELGSMAVRVLGEARAARESIAGLIAACGRHAILARMLRNLKHVYLECEQHEAAVAVLNRMLVLDPTSARDVRDRARAYEALEAVRAALADYRRYLELAPGAADAADAVRRVRALESRAERLN